MIENDLQKLGEQGSDHRLDGLEADIWAGVAARLEVQKVSRLVLSCQVLTIAFTLAFGIATGNHIDQLEAGEAQTDLTGGMRLAPSTLLLGSQS